LRGKAQRTIPPAVDAFWTSTAVVALAEMGDKTQILALMLAARFRKPWPIIAGIFAATLLNHGLAASLGYLVTAWMEGPWFQAVLGLLFLAMAAWTLIPDKEDEGAAAATYGGVFATTLVAFFLVEIGDKTQIATSLLAANYADIGWVAFGTTLGMMLANAPAVLFGDAITRIAPLDLIRRGAALVFAALGLWILGTGAVSALG
jgi:putative Ca2+/H+ antiporter (TMEM165/GDT1 family)